MWLALKGDRFRGECGRSGGEVVAEGSVALRGVSGRDLRDSELRR